jgi:outer membrane protein OmpA-like peptidoglycan-associated protein
MKKLLLLVLMVTCLATTGFGQSPTIVLKNFDKWAFGFHVSANTPNGDATDKQSSFNLISPKFGYGATISRQISHFAGFELNYSAGDLGLAYSPYSFNSKFQQIDGRFRVNFTNGQILADYRKTQVYGFVGLGMFNYKTTLMKDSSNVELKSDWVHCIPVGIGFKKRVGAKTSLNLELGYTRLNTDKVDGVKYPRSGKDGYTDLRLGIQFTLGGKKNPLEWDEPLAYFKPLAEHSVDTVVIIKKETVVVGDTATKQPVKTLTMFYETGDHIINGIYTEDLSTILNQLKNNPQAYIEVLAFCDSTGKEKVNNKLVLKRSRLVRDYFINNDITEDRIKVYNYGMEFAKDPIISKNRKVIIRYWKSEADKNNNWRGSLK